MTRVLLNLVLCMAPIYLRAQDGFTDIVKDYKNVIESVMKNVAPYNIDKEKHACFKNHNLKTFSEFSANKIRCMTAFREYFIASGDKYCIDRNTSKNSIMTISFVNPHGKRKTQKKKIKDVADYLCKDEIPTDSIKVTSIQVFRIYDIAESKERGWGQKQNILHIDGCSIFDLHEEGNIAEKDETQCKFAILHTDEFAPSWKIKQNINKCDASPLFGNIEVTIWTK